MYRSCRVAVLLAVLVVSGGVLGCGSSDDDEGGAKSAASTQQGGSPATGDEGQVRAVYDAFIKNVFERRYAEACAAHSAGYAKKYPKQIGIADTCVKTMRMEFTNLPEQGRPKLARVSVVGPGRATAFVASGDSGSGLPIAFVKEGSEWKLNGTPEQ